MLRIGIDLGGTKTEIIALDTQGNIVYRKRCPSGQDYSSCLTTLAALVSDLVAEFAGELGSKFVSGND
ncbi:MAG: ROK family protein, partial [Shewanella sp.]